jgi:hypothetical protein
MLKFEGRYRGIVVQNNDPNHVGRVKVFVPGVNLQQTKNWNQKREEDKIFKVLGSNTNSSLTPEILNSQKEKLFWAEVMLPMMGMSSPGYYHAMNDVYYIGNDSDYLFQSGNKDFFAYQQDTIQALLRLAQGIQNPSYGTSPRSSINFNFPQIGTKYCVPKRCSTDGGDSDTVNSFWKTTNTPLDQIINQLPKVYTTQTVELDTETYPFPDSQRNIKDPDDVNYAVLAVELDLTNPTVLLNDVAIPSDSPIYNTNCYIPSPPDSVVTYDAPILYVTSSGVPANSYSQLPVGLTINGKKSLTNKFKLSSFDENEIRYKDGGLTVVVNRRNVNSITIVHNNNRFDYNKINAIKPLLSKKSKIIMPRAPRPAGQKMVSRGGGGAELFANVISRLLPLFMRMDAHIGGANNESRYNINRGRIPLNDPNNVKGCNVFGNVGQIHRGPMRSADYNNDWKGMMAIPGVGSHVWVMFETGDPNFAIIVGTFADQNAYKGVYDVKAPEDQSNSAESVDPPDGSTTTSSDENFQTDLPADSNPFDLPDAETQQVADQAEAIIQGQSVAPPDPNQIPYEGINLDEPVPPLLRPIDPYPFPSFVYPYPTQNQWDTSQTIANPIEQTPSENILDSGEIANPPIPQPGSIYTE